MNSSKYYISATTLTDIANAIRDLNNTTQSFTPAQMVSQINNAASLNRIIYPNEHHGEGVMTVADTAVELVGATAYADCTQLQSVNFPNCRYIDMGAFSGCVNLSNVNIPNCRYIGTYAFGAAFLTTMVPITTLNVPYCEFIDGNAFRNCKLLSSLYLNKVSRVTSLLYSAALYGTPLLTSEGTGKVYVPSSLYTAFRQHQWWGTCNIVSM